MTEAAERGRYRRAWKLFVGTKLLEHVLNVRQNTYMQVLIIPSRVILLECFHYTSPLGRAER